MSVKSLYLAIIIANVGRVSAQDSITCLADPAAGTFSKCCSATDQTDGACTFLGCLGLNQTTGNLSIRDGCSCANVSVACMDIAMYGSLIPEMPDLCSSISTCCGDITAPEGDSTPSVVNNNDWNTCMHTTKSNYSLPMFLVSKMPSIDEDIIAATSNGTTSLWWDKLSNKAGDLGDKLSDGVDSFGDSLGTYASNATDKLYAGVDKIGDRLGAFANNATDQLSNKALEEINKHRAAANRLTQKAKIGIAIGTLVALMMLFTFCCCCVKRRRGVSKQFIASSKPRFSYDDPIPTGNAASKKKGAKYSEPLVATEPIVKLERPWTSLSFLKVKGQIAYPNGDMYDGELLDGKPQGVGVFHSPGLKYEGEWKNGLKHGKGVLKYHNGDQLIGEWKEGKKIGQGQYAFDSTLAQLW